jgi:hypothetical protein
MIAAVRTALSSLVVVLLLVLLPASAGAQERPLATCFWEGPISTERPSTRGFDGRTFNYPEESATYWLARFRLPAGARLELRSDFPHGRYMSVNAYSDGAPTDALSDIDIAAAPGSVNPFHTGARRDAERRAWRVTVVDEGVPAGEREPNTVYARAEPGQPIELAYRVYEPDRGRDLTGDTGLPEPVLIDGAGESRGQAACDRINDANRDITIDTVPAELWRGATSCRDRHPAFDPIRWERFFNLDYSSASVPADCTDAGFTARRRVEPSLQGGLYSNRDSAYVFTHLDRGFGKVVVLEATLPRFPATFDGQEVMEPAQLRFWSLCTGESRVTLRTPDCLADRQVPIDAARRYTIVVSRRADRPANAVARCGVGWLDWGERGDGAGRADYGFLILRNMLVAKDFAEAIQRVPRPGAEQATMGAYFPRSTYTSKAAFEQRGCTTPAAVRSAPARSCRARLTVRAPRGSRLRRVTLYAGKRRLASVRVRRRRAVTVTVPRTRRARLRVVLRTAGGRTRRVTRATPRCARVSRADG